MASLNTALNHALAGLSTSISQSALVSRNISSAGDENYSRRTAEVHTLPGGAPSVSGLKRSVDRQILDKLLTSTSEAAGRQTAFDAIARMAALSGDPEEGQSIAAAVGQLKQALLSYEANPASNALNLSAIESARTIAKKLNSSAAEALSIRSTADNAMARAVEHINSLLLQFKIVNDSIVRGEGTPSDLADNLDQRDAILKLLSEDIGIRTSIRQNNDVLIYAESGAVLFETAPRTVSFETTNGFQAETSGQPLYIDGVAVTGEDAAMPIRGGRIAALARIRDVTAVQFMLQLDQIAAGLIRGFSERPANSSASLPDVEGLFAGTGALPVSAELSIGLSSVIRVNTLADPDSGGVPSLLRDGGFGGPDYVHNTLSFASYQARLAELSNAIDSPQIFKSSGGVGGNLTIKQYSLQAASWLGNLYRTSEVDHDEAAVQQSRAGEALSRINGVNIDEEMASLLDLEKSYQASSKVLSVVNSMLSVLMEAVS